jgi:hypothetical protein
MEINLLWNFETNGEAEFSQNAIEHMKTDDNFDI